MVGVPDEVEPLSHPVAEKVYRLRTSENLQDFLVAIEVAALALQHHTVFRPGGSDAAARR